MYHLAAVFCFNFLHYIRTTRKAETLEGLKQKTLQHFKPFCSLICTCNLLSLGTEKFEAIKCMAVRKQNYLILLLKLKLSPYLYYDKKLVIANSMFSLPWARLLQGNRVLDAEQHRPLYLLSYSILLPDTSSLIWRATSEKVIKGFRL